MRSILSEELDLPALLDLLIDPISEREFFSEYWENKPLVVSRGEPRRFAAITELSTIISYILAGGAQDPYIKVVNRGAKAPLEVGVFENRNSARHSALLNPTFLLDAANSGDSLSIRALQRHLPDLYSFSLAMEQELGCAVQCNVYLTPPFAQALTAHYDTHDVFILQISGSKRWRVWSNEGFLPEKKDYHTNHPDLIDSLTSNAPSIDCLLRAGDTLWLPRGTVHEGVAEQELSAHVTVGLFPPTVWDVLIESVDSALADDPIGGCSITFTDAPHAATETISVSSVTRIIEQVTIRLGHGDIVWPTSPSIFRPRPTADQAKRVREFFQNADAQTPPFAEG